MKLTIVSVWEIIGLRGRSGSMRNTLAFLLLLLLSIGVVHFQGTVPLVLAASQTDINTAIEKGLAYLNRTQDSDGHWGNSYQIACTAMAVLAFENAPNSHLGWNLTDAYHVTVQKGLDWVFSRATVQPIDMQPAGNPDTNGNGFGIYFSDGQSVYETPMVLMAIVASQAKTNLTSTGPANVTGRTYRDVAVDVVDYLVWAECDAPSSSRGGWRYQPNEGDADNSVSQWPVLGLMAAELWGINAPGWVKSELNYWVAADQDLTGNSASNSNYGSFGYTGADQILGGVIETATGILELTYIGATSNNASITAAEGYINRMWNYYDGSWNVNLGSLYDMYAVMKAMREAVPPIKFIVDYNGIPSVEWYNGTGEYADALLANQASEGSWVNWKNWAEDLPKDLSTAFGVLILEYVPVKVTYKFTVDVVDAVTNNSIAGAAVLAEGPETRSGNTENGGETKFDNVQAGTYQVTVSMKGYSPSTPQTVSLTGDAVITIRLQPTSKPAPTWDLKLTLVAVAVLGLGILGSLSFLALVWFDTLRRRRRRHSFSRMQESKSGRFRA
jgi:hypothetical protein